MALSLFCVGLHEGRTGVCHDIRNESSCDGRMRKSNVSFTYYVLEGVTSLLIPLPRKIKECIIRIRRPKATYLASHAVVLRGLVLPRITFRRLVLGNMSPPKTTAWEATTHHTANDCTILDRKLPTLSYLYDLTEEQITGK